jgi:tetratricopeptide (TPR) repeat protein
LVIGYASGVTAGSVARHEEVERIDAVEIEPAMVEASRQFARENGNPLDDPRVRIVLEDARTFIAKKQGEYDAIISEPSNPWMSGVASLFTKEFFQKAHAALGPDGRLLQWVQLYGLEPRALQSILAAIRASFPYVYGFAAHEGDADLLILATKRPLARDDLPRWEKLSPAVRSDLERIGSFSTYDLWTLLRHLPQSTNALSQAAEPNSDDNLFIEMSSAWMLYEATIDPNWRMLERGGNGVVPLLRQLGEPLGSRELGGLALAYASRGESVPARTLAQEALRQDRSAVALTANAAAGKESGGEAALQSQVAFLEEAIRTDPDAIEPRLMRAELERGVEMWQEVLADVDAVLRVDPEEPRAQMLRATALARLGRTKEALDVVRPIVASDYVEYDPDAWRLLVELEVAEGRLDAAHDILRNYLHREDSGWVDGWSLLAELAQALGRPAEAEAARRNATNTRRNQSIIMQRDARRAIAQGEPIRARQLLELAVEMDPENRLARADLEGLGKTAPLQAQEH